MRVFRKRPTAKRFTIELRDHQGITRRFSGLTDRRQTEQMGRRIEALAACRSLRERPDIELSRWLETASPALTTRLADVGIVDGSRITASKSLDALVECFTKHLEAKERTTKYISENKMMLQRTFKACRFAVWSDIQPGKIEAYLKRLRNEGLSIRRSNGYLTAIKSFCRWMEDTGQTGESPVRGLRQLNDKTDSRRKRRAATPEELRKILAMTTEAPESFGMSGPERALLYRFCAETGLRKNEVRNLTAGDFDLGGLTVTVPAGYSKHRETDIVPLREDLAEALRRHLSGRLPQGKAFGGRYRKMTDKTAVMFREDLRAAGVPYQDDRGQILDFHALRHTFITGLSHAPSRVAQSLARHKSSAMTDRYTHVRLNDERSALALLPDLTRQPKSEQAKATGTDDVNVTGQFLNTTGEVRKAKSGARFGAPFGTNAQISAQLGAKQNRVPDIENAVIERAREDSNLQPSDSKSATLSN